MGNQQSRHFGGWCPHRESEQEKADKAIAKYIEQQKKAVAEEAAKAARKRIQDELDKKKRLDDEEREQANRAAVEQEQKKLVEEVCTAVYGELQKPLVEMFKQQLSYEVMQLTLNQSTLRKEYRDFQEEAVKTGDGMAKETEGLRSSVRHLTQNLERMEEKLMELEVEQDEICSECGPEEKPQKGPKARTYNIGTPEKKNPHDSEPEFEEEVDSNLSQRDRDIIAGTLIPRMKTAERIDMIEWSKLNLIKPKVAASSSNKTSYNKWDEIVIMKLGYPPRREESTWRLWKEGVWHWARELREVGASFVMLGRSLVQSAFRGYEGEHSVATSAGEARDLISVMTLLDEHFAPHTRTIQSRIESDLYKIRRLDKQSPMLFLHLLQVIFRREKEIAEGKFTRTEESKVSRALDALGLSRETTQMLRVTINQTAAGGAGGGALGGGLYITPGAPVPPRDPKNPKKGTDKTAAAPDGSGRELYVPPKNITAEEKQRQIDASNKFKLKKDPNADWCKQGDFCSKVLQSGECDKKHLSREYWRMISQFQVNHPREYAEWNKKREERKKAEEAAKKAAKK
eukprot:g16724.t1